ncbi:MAG: hypothetical protein H0T92_00850 [Pyrinomonadaceae bacterium]|nr:hypothetical protein [Pyrinomonadaceae bacterium]
MKSHIKACVLLLSLSLTMPGVALHKGQQTKRAEGNEMRNAPTKDELDKMIRRFAPTEITADASRLSVNDRKALDKIIEAARYMDEIYLRQVWSGNVALRSKLQADRTPLGGARLHHFMLNKGPWSRIDRDEPFIPGVPAEKPPQAGFYPDDITKAEFNSWLQTLAEQERRHATGFFHVVRRGAEGKLKLVPYSEEYRQPLEPAARLLREAAELTTNQTLKRYLTLRADAFMSNDYYASDVAWMDLDAPIDVTIGPYEVYEDELFNYKAAFEVFVTLRDEAESGKLARFGNYLQDLENNLPIDSRYRNPKIGALSPIRVVNVVFTAGDANRGVQTAAFNLPNDERVVAEKGSKRVMLKNVQEAKFSKVLQPISKVTLDPAQLKDVSFEAFFTHILAHELMHGLGPHNIKANGKATTVRQQLKERYSAIEEAKADVTGLWALQYLIDKGVVDRRLEGEMYTTFLASMFRSVRFGITEAHGRGVALQFNYLTDEGGIKYNEATEKFQIDPTRIKEAVRKLTGEILTLQAEGSYEKAGVMLDKYARIGAPMQRAFDKLKDVPVDIEPKFTSAEKVGGGGREP